MNPLALWFTHGTSTNKRRWSRENGVQRYGLFSRPIPANHFCPSINAVQPSRGQPLRGAIYFGLDIGSSCSEVEGVNWHQPALIVLPNSCLIPPTTKNHFSFSGAAGCNPGPFIDRWIFYLGASCFDPLAGQRYSHTRARRDSLNILSPPNCTLDRGTSLSQQLESPLHDLPLNLIQSDILPKSLQSISPNIETSSDNITAGTMESPYNNDRLPFEVLGSIFQPVAVEGPLQLRGALHVCKAWHAAVVLHCTLWTSIVVNRNFAAHFGGYSTLAYIFISHCVQRSGGLPLSVELDMTKGEVPSAAHAKANSASRSCRAALPLLMRHFREIHILDRCVSLKWDAKFIDFQTLAPFLHPALPELRHLSVKNFSSDPKIDLSLFPHCPRITMVTMSNYTENLLPSFSPEDVANVKTLTYHNSAQWVPNDIAVMRRFSSLHSLVLATGDFGPIGPRTNLSPLFAFWRYLISEPYNYAITLPLLTFLHIHGEVPEVVLKKLDTPSLLNMHVTADYSKHRHSMLMIPHTSFKQYPSTLSLQLEAPFADTDNWIDPFVALVESMRNLQAVHITPTMAHPRLSARWKWKQVPMSEPGEWLIFTRGPLVSE